jgi:hypothetical protein
MILLAITPNGLADALRTATADDTVWCGSDAITEADYASSNHSNLSRFIYALGDGLLINDALGTIEELHPSQSMWVDCCLAVAKDE